MFLLVNLPAELKEIKQNISDIKYEVHDKMVSLIYNIYTLTVCTRGQQFCIPACLCHPRDEVEGDILPCNIFPGENRHSITAFELM